jgi:creatinine amidohydrolase
MTMTTSSRSYLLTDLSWPEVRAHLAHDSRLIVPVGVCDQYGPHLPLGTGTRLAEAVACDLSQDFGVLRAPVLPHGVALPSERRYAGATSLREKTLHRIVNDLLASWEDHGFTDFLLITAHTYDPHVEAIATATGTTARIRVVDLLDIDFTGLVDGTDPVEHGGEVVTSLMLYLHPDKVNLERAEDFAGPRRNGGPRHRLARLPADSPGNLGTPSLATADKGRRIYQHIVQKIRSRVFLNPDEAAEE